MNIFNVRFGFATNSSSTHSLIQLHPGIKVSDKDACGSEFGWSNFTCASLEAKQRYLSQTLMSHFRAQNDLDSINADYFKFLLGISEEEFHSSVGGHIDHQSLITLPRNFNGHGLDVTFFKELAGFILKPDVAILGGNDNNDYDHPLLAVYQKIKRPFFLDEPNSEVVARWDETSKYWTLFNRTSGTKVRFSFRSDEEPPKASEVPDLVDIKITDKCFFACPFCYQGSTPEGDEASTTYLSCLADEFARNKVFEVALGGGEPTLHPNFIQILQYFKGQGVIPNFTTKSLAWFKDMSFVSILPKIGSFAYSAQTPAQIRQLRTTLDFYADTIYDIRRQPLRPNIHLVMGLHQDYEFRSLIKECVECRFTPVLLGFKSTGRGSQVKAKLYETWVEDIVKVFDNLDRSCQVGIDTVLASEYKEKLEEKEVPFYLYHTKEGMFSCYVDAVKKELVESSFSGEPVEFSYNELENFKELYQGVKKD